MTRGIKLTTALPGILGLSVAVIILLTRLNPQRTRHAAGVTAASQEPEPARRPAQ